MIKRPIIRLRQVDASDNFNYIQNSEKVYWINESCKHGTVEVLWANIYLMNFQFTLG
jgi:hypothetical protein